MKRVPIKCAVCGALGESVSNETKVKCQCCGTFNNVDVAANNFNIYFNEEIDCGTEKSKPEDFIIEDGILVKYTGSSADVIIPGGVREIASECFVGKKLKSIGIPSSLKKIHGYAFENCIDDNILYLSVYIADLASWCNIEFENTTSNPMYMGARLYFDGRLVTQLNIPEAVTEIKDSAFVCCNSITKVKMHNGVTAVGAEAFLGCQNLTSVTMSKQLKYIGNMAFGGCDRLSDVTMYGNVTEISPYMFNDCDSLVSVKIPDGVKKIGTGAFENCNSLKHVEIPESVICIGDVAFRSKNLTDVVMSGDIEDVGEYAFAYYWEAQGLCPRCGRTLKKTLIGKKCKKCKYDHYIWG